MRLLLDTHAFLWFILADARLSSKARTLIEDGTNEILLSAASHWEIAVKVCVGKLILAEPFSVLIPREIRQNNLRLLPIELTHTAMVCTLPLHHRDPFDRLLIAQAVVEQVPLLSADSTLDAYPITRLW